MKRALLLVFALGCAPAVEELHAPGELGPFGVEVSDRSFRVRGDEQITALVLAPQRDEPAPIALVVQGGAVPVERYRWMAERLASRGLIAVMPRHVLDLAIFESANGLDAVEALHRASEDPTDPLFGAVDEVPGIVLGHSLGGVLATSHWLRGEDRLRHLAVFAGQPNPADEFVRAPDDDARVVTITGSLDARISPEVVRASYEAFAPMTGTSFVFTGVEGMSHFQLTDDPTPENLETDGDPTLELDAARDAAFFLVDALADSLVEGAPPEVLDDPGTWPAALTVSE